MSLQFWKKKGAKKERRKGIVGVHVTPKGIAMAYLAANASDVPHIQAHSYQATDDLLPALRRFVVEHALEGVPCNYVLPGPDYTLTLIDTPNVAQTEMKRAMQWLVREVINFPVEEAIMDSFELPVPRARDNVKLSYVSVIRRSVIPQIEGLIKPTGLDLQYIDIPELVLRNIAEHAPEETRGTALAQLFPLGGRLVISRGGALYSTRFFDLRLDSLHNTPPGTDVAPVLEQLALEIQRSLDYFTSTFRQTIATTILIAPTVLDQALIQQSIQTTLGIQTRIFDLKEFLKFEQPITPDEQAKCLLAIGATLRPQEVAK